MHAEAEASPRKAECEENGPRQHLCSTPLFQERPIDVADDPEDQKCSKHHDETNADDRTIAKFHVRLLSIRFEW